MTVLNHRRGAQEPDNRVWDFWVIDSAATHHFIRDEKLLQKVVSCSDKGKTLKGFSGESSSATCTGDYVGYLFNPRREVEVRLDHVVCVPDSKLNLLSVSRLTTDFSVSFIIKPSSWVIMDLKTNEVISQGKIHGCYYIIGVSRRKLRSLSATNALRLPLQGPILDDGVDAEKDNDYCAESADAPPLDDLQAGGAWIVDTGACAHTTNNEKFLRNLRPPPEPTFVRDFAGRQTVVTQVGDAYLPGRGHGGITLHGVFLVPEAKGSIISVRKLMSEHPCCAEFRPDGFVLRSLEENRVIAEGPKHWNWYWWLHGSIDPSSPPGEEKEPNPITETQNISCIFERLMLS